MLFHTVLFIGLKSWEQCALILLMSQVRDYTGIVFLHAINQNMHKVVEKFY